MTEIAVRAGRSLDELEGVIEQGLRTFVEVGQALKEIRDRDLHQKAGYTDFDAYCRERWRFSRIQAHRMIEGAGVAGVLPMGNTPGPANERQARALAPLKTAPQTMAAAWEEAVETAPGGMVTAAHVATVVERYAPTMPLPPPPTGAQVPKFYTVDAWRSLSESQRRVALARRDPHHGFNAQTGDSIEWARFSWNPVTGCKHDCSYCYARDIAARYFVQGFVPAFLPERLDAPRTTRVPADKVGSDAAYRNVFTCSMADLFGRWVPAAWIEAVLDQVRANAQWNFLFLTKFPIRLREFAFPDNAWVGTTVDAQARVKNAEQAFAQVEAKVKWLSCEPLLEPLRFSRLDLFDWLVIGGASTSTETPEWRPPRAWINDLERQAADAGIERIYEKTNLIARRREYPGQPLTGRVNVPDAFKMGYLQRDVLEPKQYVEEMAE